MHPLGVTTVHAFLHQTVLLDEAVAALQPHDGGTYVDCTFGAGGHTRQLLHACRPSGRVIALDQDDWAIAQARDVLEAEGDRFTLVRSNFRDLGRIAADQAWQTVDGVLFDLGVSSPQFDEAERGFSYRFDAPLDMRMDTSQPLRAIDLVNHSSEGELTTIFQEYGEERFARRIAQRIVRQRTTHSIETTGELADLVKNAIPAATRRTGPHPARRVFQALRIAVNDELGALREALAAAFDIVAPGGRLAVITFHSLEDRIVKHAFVQWSTGCICPPDFPVCQCGRSPAARIVTRKAIVPQAEEIEQNPRARSARLRVLEKQ